MNCTYCPRPAYTENCTRPPLCEQHYDLALIRAHLAHAGLRFTPGNVVREMERKAKLDGTVFSFEPAQVPELMDQMLIEDWAPAMAPA